MTRRDDFGIERGDRLVGQDQLGALHQRARDRGALLLAARERGGALERPVGDADALQRVDRQAALFLAETEGAGCATAAGGAACRSARW